MIVTRRKLIVTGIGAATGAAAGATLAHPASAPHAGPLSAPILSPLQKFMRIRSSEPGRRTFWWYSGQLMGRIGDTPLQPLFSIFGASQTVARWQDDGSIFYDMVEAGYYGEIGSNLITDAPIENPLTGKMVQPEPYLSPQKLTFTQDLTVQPRVLLDPERGTFDGTITPPDEKRDRIWMAERLLGMLHETPERARRIFNSLANFEASRADVYGTGGFVPATMQYTTMNSFRPWMNMGVASGHISMLLNAVKLERWSAVEETLRSRIEKDHPRLFGDA